MKNAVFGVLLAIQFLSRLPVPLACPWTPATRRWAARAYPLVGALLGALVAGAGTLLEPLLPTQLLALALLSLWVALTGGLHLDGVMDLADALGSNAPLEKRFAIMKDPQVGSFGILALVFLLAWKLALLWALLDAGAPSWGLVALLALGRLGGVGLLILVPAARAEGMAHAWQQSLTRGDLALAAALPLALSIWLPGGAWLAAGLVVFIMGYGLAMRRAFGGINGDIVGAAIEGGELWLLLIAWSWWSCVTA
ncbi:adenosylcobinamide-GDP ribazoletransferase [Halomonas saccharevitans]|uniref:Adenosylcobinamide-GDP ribazoletransferase n=1 Tax=Halomonas saccharevitans TaxID=416872 RepID=A0A1I7AME3_9GAMM|nr:adenosylcobinamide-GDP ribazoletransferase [Halomonas saccharevitans]SFT76033.1 cobalamin-5'-phosphate synthase [Halomonas saccharevitans]